jgi:hypothetical protein
MASTTRQIAGELREHVPFTMVGALTGILVTVAFFHFGVPRSASLTLFEVFHPGHVLLSAVVTSAMYRMHSRGRFLPTLLVGYVGSVGIGTLSDCLIPYLGEWLLDMPHAHAHIGFIEEWYLVNPAALLGILVGWSLPRTKLPHTGHVLLSTFASLFHMTMALGEELGVVTAVLMGLFLFVAVWLPCCMSDIVFPLLFTRGPAKAAATAHGH